MGMLDDLETTMKVSLKKKTGARLEWIRQRRERGLGKPGRCLAGGLVFAFAASGEVVAQEALFRNLQADSITQQLRTQLENQPYTLRFRDLRILLNSSAGLEWNDNLKLTEKDRDSDFSVTPSLSIHASHPIGAANLFTFDLGLGYSKYFSHDELDRFNIVPGSSANLNMAIGDVLVNFHNRLSYRLDPVISGAVSGSADFGGIDNSAGVSATLTGEKTSASIGYDFVRTISASSEFSYLDRMSHQFIARGGVRVHPSITAGVEATVSPSMYDEHYLNDSLAYSGGVYAEWMVTEQLRLSPRAGYSLHDFKENEFGFSPKDRGSFYYGIQLKHRPSMIVEYGLNVSQQMRPGVNANLNETFEVQLTSTWFVVRDLPIQASLLFEDAKESYGRIEDNFVRIGGTLGANYQLTEKSTLSLTYGYITKDSKLPDRDYGQHRVTLMFTYRF